MSDKKFIHKNIEIQHFNTGLIRINVNILKSNNDLIETMYIFEDDLNNLLEAITKFKETK